jgi:hypothetical protein
LLVVVGRREEVVDAVLPADSVEQHLGVFRSEPAREHLAVVGEELGGNAVPAHGVGEVRAHRSARGPLHEAGADHEA